MTPSTTFHTEIFEGAGHLRGRHADHADVQPADHRQGGGRAGAQLTTSKPVVGAWYWDGSEHLDFRPRDYWPANTTVSFSSHLDGVEGAPGVYGVHDLSQTFNIGQSVIAVANTSTFRTQIYVGGKLTYTWPISHRQVRHADAERHLPDRREGQPGPHDRRQEGQPGLLQRTRQLGGPVHFQRRLLPLGTVVGRQPGQSQRQPRLREPGARGRRRPTTTWPSPATRSRSRAARRRASGTTAGPNGSVLVPVPGGSATHMAVEAGPTGSTLANPSTLPADTATAPLATSTPGNFSAA